MEVIRDAATLPKGGSNEPTTGFISGEPILFTVGALIAIGVGGGLIKPMQERWERILTAAERETNTQIAAYQQGRTDAMRAAARPPG